MEWRYELYAVDWRRQTDPRSAGRHLCSTPAAFRCDRGDRERLDFVEQEIDHIDQMVDIEGLLKDHRALSFEVGEPGLPIQRGDNDDRNALAAQPFLDG